MMKTMAIDKYGKTPLRLMEKPVPEIEEYEVLVETHAASINPVDYKIRNGDLKMLIKFEMPLVLGSDFSGVVTKVGSKVTRFEVGDEVYGRPRAKRMGTFAEFLAVHEDDIALKPKNLSFEEAASIPLVGLTSYQVLKDILNLQKGQRILIHAGSGGVGSFAIQLAKLMGATVTTTVSEKGRDLVESLGVDEIVNYKTDEIDNRRHYYDAAFDTVGGETLSKTFKTIRSEGHIASIAGTPNARFAKEQELNAFKTMLLSIISAKISSLEKKHDVEYTYWLMKPSGEQLGIITEFIEAGEIRPVIDTIYSFEDAQKAMEYSEAGSAKGKIILKIKG